MPYPAIHPYRFDCSKCLTRCDGISKGIYQFESDAAFSEKFEKTIMEKVNSSALYYAEKSATNSYPDITVYNKEGHLKTYLEVKVQQRAFMSVKTCLPAADLEP